jgi:outer membrane protein assembly factor BamB
MKSVLLRAFLLAAVAVPLAGENWPGWRGPGNLGVSGAAGLPLRWSRDENVRWRAPLPERGNSTPIIWGDRIFLTQPLEKQQRRTLMCLRRSDGKVLWQSGVGWTEKEASHRTNPFCSSSPVTDGKRVFAWFGSAGLAAYDFDGKEIWHRKLGRQHHIWGYGSSPILHDGLVILNFGPGEPSFLIAVKQSNGETVWKVDLPGRLPREDVERQGQLPSRPDGAVREDFFGSWTTPLMVRVNGRDELVVNLPKRVVAFDPKTGKEIWRCEGFADLAYGSPVLGEDGSGLLIASLGGFGGPGLVVRPGGNGNVTESRRLWHQPRTTLRIGSSIIHAGHIYTVGINGVAECLELATGRQVWVQRLSGPGGNNAIWSSLVRNGDKLYVMNQSGDTFVFRAAPKFEQIAVSSLGEETNSSVVASGGDLFLRTHESLWRIGNMK